MHKLNHSFFNYTAKNAQNILSKLICSQNEYLNIQQYCLTWLEETTSTNDVLKLNLKRGNNNAKQILITWQQTAGKGTNNRVWHSNQKECLMLSISMPTNIIQEGISLVCGLAVYKALQNFLNLSKCITNQDNAIKILKVKYPNDILLHDKKLAGILIEGITNGNKQYLIIGIGLNWLTPLFYKQSNKTGSNINPIGLDTYLIDKTDEEIFIFINDIIMQIMIHVELCSKYGFTIFNEQWLNIS